MTISVLIADDQQLMRAGLRLIVERAGDMEVVAEVGTGELALHSARRLNPDVVLMDIQMPEMDGLEATRRLLADPDNRSRVVVLTTFDLDEYVYAALRAGAAGFLLKGAPAEQLLEAIRVGRGRRCPARPRAHAPADRRVRPPPGARRARRPGR